MKKKLVSVLLAFVMCMSLFAVTAFASENEAHTSFEEHTVTLNIAPGGNAEIMPAMWEQNTYTVGVGLTTYTPQFVIPDRYFAYEMSATGVNGQATSVAYSVTLMRSASTPISGMGGTADGSPYKNDWIDLYSSGLSCLFKIVNSGSSAIKVTLTYYSWK